MIPTLWFDAEHTHAAAGAVLLTPEGSAILQLRDDIPGIDNPGRITAFGGGAERHETPLQCAVRELGEETGLAIDPERLQFLGEVSKRDSFGHQIACVFFLLEGVELASLRVTEGKPIVLSLDAVAADPRPTPFCKQLCAHIGRR